MQTDPALEMSRKLMVHSTLDHVFSAQYDVSRLPQLISQVGMQYIGCEFVSMWRYEPSEKVLYNLVARSNLSASDAGEQYEIPTGAMRHPVRRGPGCGIMMNLAADVLDGKRFEDMRPDRYIVNDRVADERATPKNLHQDASIIRSSMYAPLVYNGFKGMMVALNHDKNQFTRADWEILKILASKASIVVDNIEQRKTSETVSRLAFLGGAVDLVRHELKAPLTAINGAAKVILRILPRLKGDEADLALVDEMARMVASDVERNVRMLSEIQNYCKPQLEFPRTTGEVNKFLQENVETIVNAAGERKPTLVLKLSDDLPKVAFSPDHLLEVLRNLVRNAAEHGSRQVKIVTDLGVNLTDVIIDVTDDGGGVDDDVLGTFFQPYETSKSRQGGSGLGLFICRRIIEEGHGGRLSASNVYDDARQRTGLCFRIELPGDNGA